MTIAKTVFDCSIIDLPVVHSVSGKITVVDGNKEIPFEVKRIYYLYDIPNSEQRGGHAHKDLRQLIVAGSGSFEIVLNDGVNQRIIRLDRPNYGLLVVPGIWRELRGFSSGAICLVLASHEYDESDYIRNYKSFLKWKS